MDEQLNRLEALPLEAIWGALGDYRVNYVRGFTSTQPGERVAGRALTMRFLPPRPDLVQAVDTLASDGDWDRRYYARAAEEARPGDIVVAELGGSDGHNLFGAMGALGIKLRGVAGVIIDGGSRDLIEHTSLYSDLPGVLDVVAVDGRLTFSARIRESAANITVNAQVNSRLVGRVEGGIGGAVRPSDDKLDPEQALHEAIRSRDLSEVPLRIGVTKAYETFDPLHGGHFE